MDKIAEANSEIAANDVFSGEFVHVWNCARGIIVIRVLFHRIQKRNLFYLLFLSPRQRKPPVIEYCDIIMGEK